MALLAGVAQAQETQEKQPAAATETQAATGEAKQEPPAATPEPKSATPPLKPTQPKPAPQEAQQAKPDQAKAEKEPKKEKKPEKPKAKWQFHPFLNTSVSYDETIYPRVGTTRDPVDTFVTTIGPGFQVRRQQGRNYTDLRYTLYARFYEELKERDSLNHSLYFAWYERPSDKWWWRFTDRFSYLEDTGGEEDDSVTRLITYTDNRASIDTDIGFASQWNLLLGCGYQVRDNDDPLRADWYTVSPMWGLVWKPDGPGRWSLRHEFKYLDIDEGEDERSQRILAGYGTTLPWKLDLDVGVGVLYLEDINETDPAGLIKLQRNWQKVRTSLRYERSASVSTGTSQVVRRDYASFTPVWRVAPKTTLIGSLSYLLQTTKATDLIDTTTWRSGVSVSQGFNKWLTGTLGYTYVDQDSRGTSGITLHGSIISAGLSARF